MQPTDADGRGIECEAGLLVFGREPTGPDAPIGTSAGEHVEGRELLGVRHRVAVVVARDVRAHSDVIGRVRGGGQGRDHRELRAEVIGYEKVGAAGGFDSAAERTPFVTAGSGLGDHAEPERMLSHYVIRRKVVPRETGRMDVVHTTKATVA